MFEVKLDGFESSIIAGGRYDGLIDATTLIGFSIGVTRLMNFVRVVNEWKEEYYLTSLGNVSDKDKFQIFNYCKHNITSKCPLHMNLTKDKKLGKLIMELIQNKIRYLIIVGEEELKQNSFIVRDLKDSIQRTIIMKNENN